MREAKTDRSFLRIRKRVGLVLARFARIGIALSLVVSLFGVHFSLAHAEAVNTPGIGCCMVDLDPASDILAVENAVHLAGHLTFIAGTDAPLVTTFCAKCTRRPISADALPLSTFLPAPAEPPRT
jgi:hypothetical protein